MAAANSLAQLKIDNRCLALLKLGIAQPSSLDKVERKLWRDCFAALNAPAQKSPRARRRLRARRARAAACYRGLLEKSTNDHLKYRCLARLGDLSRYGGREAAAAQFYEEAASLAPGRGDADNALGVLAQAQGRLVSAAFRYARAAGAARPFPGSARNLAAAVKALSAADDAGARAVAKAFAGDHAGAAAAVVDLRAKRALSAARLAECDALLAFAATRHPLL